MHGCCNVQRSQLPHMFAPQLALLCLPACHPCPPHSHPAVPVVHAVGGLRDTVKPFNPFENTGTGEARLDVRRLM